MSNEANCVSGSGAPQAGQMAGGNFAAALRERIRAFDLAICELEVGGYVGVSPAVNVLHASRDRVRKELHAYEEACKRTVELEARPRSITIRTVQARVDQAECRDQGGRILWARHGAPEFVRSQVDKLARFVDSVRDETVDGANAAGSAKMTPEQTARAADKIMVENGPRLPPELR